MKIFVGSAIIIISMSIIAFLFYYFHFYMFAWGRGMPEALFYERVIATVLTSTPFIAFIYLAWRNLICGNDKENKTIKI